jgi:hypothetical protein
MKNDTTNKLTFDCELKVKQTNKQTNKRSNLIIIGAIRCKRGLGSQIDEGSFKIIIKKRIKQTKITRTHEMGDHPQQQEKHARAHTC